MLLKNSKLHAEKLDKIMKFAPVKSLKQYNTQKVVKQSNLAC